MSTYMVRSGDTLSGIAARYHRSVAALTKLNHLRNANLIRIGQKLQLGGGTSAAKKPSGSTLKRGARGSAVLTLQKALVKVGAMSTAALRTGPGIFGPRTETALKHFQAQHHLPATGVYDARTHTALAAALKKKAPAKKTAPVKKAAPKPSSKATVTAAQLHKIMPNLSMAKARQYAPMVSAAMAEAGITTKRRKAMFLAQLAHESGGLRWFEELASGAAYEGRKDLGNTHPGDGRRYKGRGPIQLTGRANYRAAGKALHLPLEAHPTLAAQPKIGFRIAAWFWKSRGLNALADRGDFIGVTRRINGGTNGLASRQMYYKRALAAL